MLKKFSNTKLNQCLLFLSVIILLLNSYELTFFVWALTAFITIGFKYSLKFIKLTSVLIVVIIISYFSSLFKTHSNYHFFRDIAYLVKPILGLLIGYNITKKLGKQTIYLIINTGVALAICHILIVGICYSLFSIKNIHDLRHFGGYFNDFEIYVLILLIFKNKFYLNLNKSKTTIFIVIITFSTFLYLARTNIIQLVILIIAMKGYLKLTAKSIKIITSTILFVLVSYTLIYYSYPVRSSKGFEAFLYKVKLAPIEAFKTKINEDDWKEFNDNFRSFENIKTVKQLTSDGWFTMIFGKGLGSTVDIGREMWTNDGTKIRFEPTLHNAYMTIFLKSGLIGIFLSLIFIYILYYNNSTSDEKIKYINYLIVGSAIYLILSNWVFMGLYLKLDNKSIFLGFLLCYKELLLKENNLENE